MCSQPKSAGIRGCRRSRWAASRGSPEQEEGEQRDHHGDGLHHQGERGEDAVHASALVPGGEDADDGADGEAQNGGGAHQEQGPADGAAEDVGKPVGG